MNEYQTESLGIIFRKKILETITPSFIHIKRLNKFEFPNV